jgi:hypothetical protein
MSKYAPLAEKLKSIHQREWPTSFKEIERTLGFCLPKSAREHRAWWSNNPSNSVMTKTWVEAGWRTEQVDMEKEKLVFRKAANMSGAAGATKRTLFGALAGSVRILRGDLTKPTGESWKAER